MKPLFDIRKIDHYKYDEMLPLICEKCSKLFYKKAKYIKHSLKYNTKKNSFCSIDCKNNSQITKINTECKTCQKSLKIFPSTQKKSKSGNSFCSKKCAGIYNSSHKTIGNNRSKLEKWIEEQLANYYPTLEIKYNDKTTINSELDIYIPSINLAFELNGVFHYEPIFGPEKLSYIQNNDNRKFQACLEKQIELVIIDASLMKNFKPIKAEKYIKIIISLINMKLNNNSVI